MSTKIKTKKIKASDMFFLAIVSICLIFVEPILLNLFNMYGFGMAMALRAICIVIWSFGAAWIISMSKKEGNFDVISKSPAPSKREWILISIVTAAALAYFVWSKLQIIGADLKGLTSLQNIVAFSSMILVSLFKAIVITLIITFAQKGFEVSFKAGKWIPFGGIVMGLIWAGMFTLSSIELMSAEVGFEWIHILYQFAYGIVCGLVLVASGNKARYAFPFIAALSIFIFLS